ncbi:hypothetical protein IY145_24435 [Methylosinus sp. H3A]|uniref:hypothetical protein n=1 Tax=Methylosinus sp. H3A TaxID=2785786 RepID=UPI0018C1DD25|nr:hypothetical protein [Methylosinus sp. H3A]MBG0812481.1 hypothetical protein [Methylosinus sp. H3A]
MTKAFELQREIDKVADCGTSAPSLDDYGVIAMGLRIDPDAQVRFWRNGKGASFFTVTFSDGSKSVYDARGCLAPAGSPSLSDYGRHGFP